MFRDTVIPKIIVICGPTCSGKTEFAINLASQFNGEIISADSMQVYRYMNIGTAKPTVREQTLVYHHMIDIVDPDQNFDAAKYSQLARASIERTLARGRNAFVVGGTGFYIRALVQGLINDVPNDGTVRGVLKQQVIECGAEWLYKRLLKIDKVYADKIHKNDVFRIVRAIEIFEITGKTMTDLQNEHKIVPSVYNVLNIGIIWSRLELYQRIDHRVDKMINQGFVDEVRRLLNSGYLPSLKSMSSLGYRHISNYLGGDSKSWNEVLNTLKRDHRRYAKRQLTWFNANPSIHWINADQIDKAVGHISVFL